jgi:hypothetical protein
VSRIKDLDGAGNETRTRDPQLGKLMLYQLSYSRTDIKVARETVGSKRGLIGCVFARRDVVVIERIVEDETDQAAILVLEIEQAAEFAERIAVRQ